MYTGDFFPDVRPAAAWTARLPVATGRLGEAVRWAADGPVARRRPVVPARVRARHARRSARGPADARRHERATPTPARAALSAAQAGADGTVIEIQDPAGARPPSAAATRRTGCDALARARDPSPNRRATSGRSSTPVPPCSRYSPRPPGAPPSRRTCTTSWRPVRRRPPAPAARGLVDPLSGRELGVLRLLAQRSRGPAIARELPSP